MAAAKSIGLSFAGSASISSGTVSSSGTVGLQLSGSPAITSSIYVLPSGLLKFFEDTFEGGVISAVKWDLSENPSINSGNLPTISTVQKRGNYSAKIGALNYAPYVFSPPNSYCDNPWTKIETWTHNHAKEVWSQTEVYFPAVIAVTETALCLFTTPSDDVLFGLLLGNDGKLEVWYEHNKTSTWVYLDTVLPLNQWLQATTHVKISDAGQSNGFYEVWLGSTLLFSIYNIDNAVDRDDGENYVWSYESYIFNVDAPSNMLFYIDNVALYVPATQALSSLGLSLSGNATVSAAASTAASGSINLQASGTSIVTSGTVNAYGSLNLNSSGNASVNSAGATSAAGTVGVNASGSSSVASGTISTAGSAHLSISGNGSVNATAPVAASGSISLSILGAPSIQLGTVSVNGSINLQLSGSASIASQGTITANGVVGVSSSGATVVTSLIAVNASGNVGLQTVGNASIQATSAVAAAGVVGLSVSGTSSAQSTNTVAASGSLSLHASGTTATQSTVAVSALGSIGLTVSGSAAVQSGTVSSAGFVGLNVSGIASSSILNPVSAYGNVGVSVNGNSSITALISVSASGAITVQSTQFTQIKLKITAFPTRTIKIDVSKPSALTVNEVKRRIKIGCEKP